MSFRLEGEKELYEALKRMGDKVAEVMKKATAEAGKVVLDDMKVRIHDVTGNLSKSLVVEQRKGKAGDWQGVRVKATAPHAHLVETGHAMKRVKGGETLGNVPAHPFARPAIRAKKAEAVAIIEKKLREAVERES